MNTAIRSNDKPTLEKNEPHWIRLQKTGQQESRTDLTGSALVRLCDEGKVNVSPCETQARPEVAVGEP